MVPIITHIYMIKYMQENNSLQTPDPLEPELDPLLELEPDDDPLLAPIRQEYPLEPNIPLR